MKKVIFGLIATVIFGLNSNAQDKFETNLSNSIQIESTESSSLKLTCTRINVGINILIAWASTDIYIGCGFPGDYFYPTGCRPISEKLCKTIEDNFMRTSDYNLNVKEFFKDVDCSKVTELEITKSDEWVDDNGQTLTIKLGKYKVDKDGNFKVEIVKKG